MPSAFRIALLWALLPATVCGQPLDADSLWAIWKDAGAADTARFDALLRLCKTRYVGNDPDSSLLLSRQLAEFARAMGSERHRAEALMLEAVVHSVAFDLDAAMALDQEALRIKEEVGDVKGQARVLNNMGVVEQNREDYATSTRYFLRSLRLYVDLKDGRGAIAPINNIGCNFRNQGAYHGAIDCHRRALSIARLLGEQRSEADALINLGIAQQLKGDFQAALESYLACLDLKEAMGDRLGMASIHMNVGMLHAEHKDYARAVEELRQALTLSVEVGNGQSISNSHENLGSTFKLAGQLDSALLHFRKSKEIMSAMGYQYGVAQSAVNMGTLYEAQQRLDLAAAEYETSLRLSEQIGDRATAAVAMNNLGKVRHRQGRLAESEKLSRASLAVGREIRSPVIVRDAALALSELLAAQGHRSEAYDLFALHVHLRDSLLSEDNSREFIRLGLEHEFEKQAALDSLAHAAETRLKDSEIARQQADLLRQRIALASAVGGLLLILALAAAIYRGKKRSDELLLNILPYETAQELKAKGSAEARLFEDATVLFTDFKGFTQISEKLSPTELVALIHECFSAFDRIMQKHGVEKIKTIGDAYMAASGLPVKDPDHAIAVVEAALDIQRFMKEQEARKAAEGSPFFQIRIGVHTGPVVAGIVGIKKFQYDIWGDTVNTASRMESSGDAGRVNISEATYERVKNRFRCIPRGEVEAKGKGMMRMYFVEGPMA